MSHCLANFRRHRSGFSLVEVLVSMVVLILLILFVTQLVNSTSAVTVNSRKRMDADSQARTVFDRLAADFEGMLLRPDVDYIFAKMQGNDKMFFYSEAPAYFSGSPLSQDRGSVSLVGYRINPNLMPALQLERLGKGLTWTGTPTGSAGGAVTFLTYPSVSASPSPATSPAPTPFPTSTLAGNWSSVIGTPAGYDDGADSDYHELSPGVFRFEYCFQLKNGLFSDKPYYSTHTAPQGMRDVSAIIVAIAILDDTSRKIVSSTDRMVAALDDFSGVDLSGTTALMATLWQNKVNSPTFAQDIGLPKTAASSVRIYQRYFRLSTK